MAKVMHAYWCAHEKDRTKICDCGSHEIAVRKSRVARMESVDAMTPELRQCVHDFGLNVVKTLMDVGVVKPKHIRHVVERVLDEFSPTRGTYSMQGIRSSVDESGRVEK